MGMVLVRGEEKSSNAKYLGWHRTLIRGGDALLRAYIRAIGLLKTIAIGRLVPIDTSASEIFLVISYAQAVSVGLALSRQFNLIQFIVVLF